MAGVKGMVLAGQVGETRVAKVPVWARAREYTDEVLMFWAGMMRREDVPEQARLRASENIMDRAWGKSPVIVMGDDDGPTRINLTVMTGEQSAALESTLMTLLGDAIADDPHRGRSIEGATIQAAPQTPVLGLPSEPLTNDKREQSANNGAAGDD